MHCHRTAAIRSIYMYQTHRQQTASSAVVAVHRSCCSSSPCPTTADLSPDCRQRQQSKDILYHPAKVPGVAGALHAPVAHAGHVPQALGQVPQSFSTTVIRLMYSLSAQHSCQSNWQHPGRPAGQSRLARVAHGVIRVLRILILAFSAPSTHPIWWLLLLITMRVQRVRLLLRNTCMARPSSEATSCWPARP